MSHEKHDNHRMFLYKHFNLHNYHGYYKIEGYQKVQVNCTV